MEKSYSLLWHYYYKQSPAADLADGVHVGRGRLTRRKNVARTKEKLDRRFVSFNEIRAQLTLLVINGARLSYKGAG